MRVLKFIFKMSKPYKLYIFGMVIAVTMVTFANTLRPYVIKQFIDVVAISETDELWHMFIYYMILQCMLVGGWFVSDYCLTYYASDFRLNVAEHYMKKLYDYPYSFFQNQQTGSSISKINDVFQYLTYIIFSLIHPFGSFILLLSISLYLCAAIAPVFAISLFIWVFLFFAITFLSNKKTMNFQRSYAEERAKITGQIADYFGNIISVKLFATKNFELNRFAKLKMNFISMAQKQGFYFMKFYLFQGIITTIYAISFIFFLIEGYKQSYVTPGDFALVIMTNFNIISLVYEMSHTLREFITNFGAVDQAVKLLEEHYILDESNKNILKLSS